MEMRGSRNSARHGAPEEPKGSGGGAQRGRRRADAQEVMKHELSIW